MRRLGSAKGSVPANKGHRYPPEPLTRAEADALISAALAGPFGLRNGAMLAVMYRSGLRLGEVLALRNVDVDEDRATVRVLHGKGDKSRVAYIGQAAAELIGRWRVERIRRGLIGPAPLFCTRDGGHLKPQYVRAMLGRLAVVAGIEKRVHPHGFRHTHAYELCLAGTPLNVISKQLGHSSSAVTSRYLDHVCNADVAEWIGRLEWTVPA